MLSQFLGVEYMISELRAEMEKYKSDAAKYYELLKEEANEVVRLKNEVEQLRKRLQEQAQPQVQPLKPVAMTYEEAWRMFCSQLKMHGIDCSRYRRDEDVKNQLMAASRARSMEEANVIIQDLVSSIVKGKRLKEEAREMKKEQKQEKVQESYVKVGPVKIPIAPFIRVSEETIKEALEKGGMEMGLSEDEIQAVTERLWKIGEMMQRCKLPNGKSFNCADVIIYGGKILEYRAGDIAEEGLKSIIDDAETFQSSLYDYALQSFNSMQGKDIRERLSQMKPDTEIGGQPLYYWLSIIAAYAIAYYFKLSNMLDRLRPEYEMAKDILMGKQD